MKSRSSVAREPLSRRRFALTAAALAVSLAGCRRAEPTTYGINITGAAYGRDFELRDPDGQTRHLADFAGKVVLLFFGFTQCPDICPTALTRAAAVCDLLGASARQLQVLFVTIDPERDTPELLRNYTAAFHPDFMGLYADAAGTAKVAQEFKVFYNKVPTGSSYTMDHTALSFLIDPRGRIRLAVLHQQSAANLALAIKDLLEQ